MYHIPPTEASRRGVLIGRMVDDVEFMEQAQAQLTAEFGDAVSYDPINPDHVRRLPIITRIESGRNVVSAHGSPSDVEEAFVRGLSKSPDSYNVRTKNFKVAPGLNGEQAVYLDFRQAYMPTKEREIAAKAMTRVLGKRAWLPAKGARTIAVAGVVDASAINDINQFTMAHPVKTRVNTLVISRRKHEPIYL